MSRHLSPTAQLLRSSRLFSLPQPLPKPVVENQVNLGYRKSDTSTTPYPTHQAISVPESSLRRGDWGFKRPLPVRDTSNEVKPFVRTVARLTRQDTIEHITDYETASDLEKTWEKFQEMAIALVRKDLTAGTLREHKSAFEPTHDFTDQGSAPVLGLNVEGNARWKFNGPSLGQMTQRDFNDFVTKKLRNQRKDFEYFLRAHVTRIYLNNRRNEASKVLQEGRTTSKLQEGQSENELPEVDTDDAASLIALGHLNWLCQLPDIIGSSPTVKQSDGIHGTWKHYRMRMLEHGEETAGTGRPGFLSYLDEISALHGRENVKENLLQRLEAIHDDEYQQMLLEPKPREIEEDQPAGAEQKEKWLQRQLQKAYMDQFSTTLSINIPGVSYLSTMIEELQSISRQDSIARIVNVLIAEWEFFTVYNTRFEQSYLKWLVRERANVTSTSPLNTLIRDFLDIPPMTAKQITGGSDSMASEQFATHPSAGLSYLKTNAYLDNHPILGPQSSRAPVDARVLSPRSSDTRGQSAHFGIGGFVVQEPTGATGSGDTDQRVAKLDPEADGGVKVPLEVPFASVDRWAAVKLQARRLQAKNALFVKEGKLTHPVMDEYRRRNTVEPLSGRFDRPLDNMSSEAKNTHSSITKLMGMLAAKQKEQDA